MIQHGPTVKTCNGCGFLESQYFAVQDDTGFKYYCHAMDRKYIDSYTDDTPDWCPFLKQEMEKQIKL